MTKALYRRYRPETFQEVIGQEHVTAPLMAALAAGNTTHAYLFSGPRGCGKTTSARILARCLNCAEYPTDTPCGKCESCIELARDGSGSLDVVELDAASHGGVDDARELREQASFAPVRDRFKIFIIDEAHMVSNQGFNALLKLVEEPPAHIKFIFATTEPEKVIGTIRSRTHHYPFRLVPPTTLEDYLSELCKQEGVSAGKDVLSLVVRAGTGSVRDTLSVLDQIIGGSDGTQLEYERAVALLGYTSAHLLDDAVSAIAASDGGALFGVVESVVKSGHDPRRFVEDLLQRLRDLVIIALAGDSVKDVFLSVPDDQYAVMVQQAGELGAASASKAADLVNEALTLMVGATAPRMQLELLCARLIVAQQAVNSPVAAPHAAPEPSQLSRVAHARSQGSGRQGAESQPDGSYAAGRGQTAANTPHEGSVPAQESMQDPRMQPMPSFEPENDAKGLDPVPTVDPVLASDPVSVADPSSTMLPAVSEDQVVGGDQLAGGEVAGDQLLQVQGAWDRIVAVASDHSKIVENMLKHATGPMSVDRSTLVVGFVNEGTAVGFNRNRRAQEALTEALRNCLGIALGVEGRAGHAAPDVHPKASGAEGADLTAPTVVTSSLISPRVAPAVTPKDASKGNARTSSEVAVEDAPPELDPVYELRQPEDLSDPAGVLAQLVDGTARVTHDSDRVTAAPEPEPFFAQDMPDLPPSDLPPSLSRFAQAESGSATANNFRSFNDHADAGTPSTGAEIVHGSFEHSQIAEPEPSGEYENEWDEVSPDDPEISQSSLVGINVVLETFGATVVEEIPHNAENGSV